MELDEIKERLNDIYTRIPSFDCKRCGYCCGPVNWLLPEDLIIREWMKNNNMEYVKWGTQDFIGNDFRCPYYDWENKLCKIYEVRPLICRLQGMTERLPCPNNEGVRQMSRQLVDNIWRDINKLTEEVALSMNLVVVKK